MASLGLKPDDWQAEDFEVWPDNAMAVGIFAACRTQWRVGPGGPYGLDYNIVDRRVDRFGLDDEKRAVLESELFVMELAALEALAR